MYKRRLFLPLFSILSILSLVFIGISQKTSVVSGTVQSLFGPIQQTTFSLFHKASIEKQSDKQLNAGMKLSDQKKLQDENAALRDQFQTTFPRSSQLLPAEVVGSPNFIPHTTDPLYLIINKGSNDHIHKGSVVVYRNIMIGTISQITNNFSQVTLTANTTTSVPVKTAATNALGIIKGQGNGELLLDNVLLSDRLQKDDSILTYGSQDIHGYGYPPDLVLGKIISVEKNPSALFQTARVEMPIDITKLKTVFIILP